MPNPTGINQYTKRGAGGVKNHTIKNIRDRAARNKAAVSTVLSKASKDRRQPIGGLIASTRLERAAAIRAERSKTRSKK